MEVLPACREYVFFPLLIPLFLPLLSEGTPSFPLNCLHTVLVINSDSHGHAAHRPRVGHLTTGIFWILDTRRQICFASAVEMRECLAALVPTLVERGRGKQWVEGVVTGGWRSWMLWLPGLLRSRPLLYLFLWDPWSLLLKKKNMCECMCVCVPGLSCGSWDLQPPLRHKTYFVAVCKILVAACEN